MAMSDAGQAGVRCPNSEVSDMRRAFWGLVDEFDTGLALAIAVVVGVLGIAGVASADLVQNAILVTLGVLAISILRDRRRQDALEARTKMIRLISEPEVARMLADARRQTDRWLFRGGTGTYTRAVTLPI